MNAELEAYARESAAEIIATFEHLVSAEPAGVMATDQVAAIIRDTPIISDILGDKDMATGVLVVMEIILSFGSQLAQELADEHPDQPVVQMKAIGAELGVCEHQLVVYVMNMMLVLLGERSARTVLK